MVLTLFEHAEPAQGAARTDRGQALRLFVCGPTVYDAATSGTRRRTRSSTSSRATCASAGSTSTYVQNITDIDDKIIARAAERGVAWR